MAISASDLLDIFVFYKITVDTNSYQQCYSIVKYRIRKKDVRQVKHGFFFWLKFVGTVFVSSIISSHTITELSIILAKYLSSYFYYNFDSSFIFYYQTYIHICMIHVLLTFLIHLFLQSSWKWLDLNLLFSLKQILY